MPTVVKKALHYRKVGGLHFMRLGPFVFMFCRSTKRKAPKATKPNRLTFADY